MNAMANGSSPLSLAELIRGFFFFGSLELEDFGTNAADSFGPAKQKEARPIVQVI